MITLPLVVPIALTAVAAIAAIAAYVCGCNSGFMDGFREGSDAAFRASRGEGQRP